MIMIWKKHIIKILKENLNLFTEYIYTLCNNGIKSCKFSFLKIVSPAPNLHAWLQAFFISNTFISNVRLKLTKKSKVKQHPETEILQFENYSHSSPTLSAKIIGHILKYKQKNKCLCSWGYTINRNENEDENQNYIT